VDAVDLCVRYAVLRWRFGLVRSEDVGVEAAGHRWRWRLAVVVNGG